MRKLVVSIVLLFVCIITLVGCGNRRYFDFEFDGYGYIHCIPDGRCYKIKSWKDNEVGIKVETEDYGVLFFSEGTYILVEKKCPICNHE